MSAQPVLRIVDSGVVRGLELVASVVVKVTGVPRACLLNKHSGATYRPARCLAACLARRCAKPQPSLTEIAIFLGYADHRDVTFAIGRAEWDLLADAAYASQAIAAAQLLEPVFAGRAPVRRRIFSIEAKGLVSC